MDVSQGCLVALCIFPTKAGSNFLVIQSGTEET